MCGWGLDRCRTSPVSQETTTVKQEPSSLLLKEFSTHFFILHAPTKHVFTRSPRLNTAATNSTQKLGSSIYNTAYPLAFARVLCTHLWNGEIFGQHQRQPKTRRVHRETPYNKLSVTTFRSSAERNGFILLKGMSMKVVRNWLWNYWMFKVQHGQYHREDSRNTETIRTRDLDLDEGVTEQEGKPLTGFNSVWV